MDIEELPRTLDEKCLLIPHTNAGRLFCTVRRMKAEREFGIPIACRTGFAISVETGKVANKMNESEWEEFYLGLCDEFRKRYLELHQRLFP